MVLDIEAHVVEQTTNQNNKEADKALRQHFKKFLQENTSNLDQ